ncbi:MAG: FHA domain-containing protein, partial [Pseudomonadota bacterium]
MSKPRLYIMNGPDKGKSYELAGETVHVGRVSNNDIRIREKSISRRHLQIRVRGDRFVLKDLNSKNGTFVNGKLITPEKEFEVEAGLPVSIGRIVIALGKECSEDIFSIQQLSNITGEFSETALFTAYKDRPMTTPKNLELIYNVSNVLMQSLDINETLEKILDHIFDLLRRIDRGVIILLDYRTGEISDVILRAPKTDDDAEVIYSRSIVNRVVKDGKPIIMLDTFGQDQAVLSASMELMKVRSVMCVPLISRSQVRGVIYVDSVNRPYGFRE